MLAEHVERLHALAGEFAWMIESAPDFELAVEPESNIVCFRFAPEDAGALDGLQMRIREKIVRSGAVLLCAYDAAYRCVFEDNAHQSADVPG